MSVLDPAVGAASFADDDWARVPEADREALKPLQADQQEGMPVPAVVPYDHEHEDHGVSDR